MGRTLPIALLALLFLAPVPGLAGDETAYPQLYYRDAKSCQSVVGILRNLAVRRRPDSLLVVFDTATFAPPPGRNEFNATHHFPGDVPAWLDALGGLTPPDGVEVFAATPLMARPLAVGGPDWWKDLSRAIARDPWEAASLRKFEPASAWVARLLGRVPGPRRMLVLVTGDALPEQWAERGDGEAWRRKLPVPGEYWDEERVAAAVQRKGASLDIVAPEARFGDFLPVTDIPEAPWASRPVLPASDTRIAKMSNLEERMERLRRLFPDASEEDLRERAERSLRRTRATTPRAIDVDGPASKFISSTPAFCPRYGGCTFFNTDCPSRYGYWPFARAAAATGGSYVFYPFPPAEFLDGCPYDPALLRALAPEYESRRRFAAAFKRDAALQAVCVATRKVIDETPWTAMRREGGWLGFESASPLALEKGHRQRDKPIDGPRPGGFVPAWKAFGRRLAPLPDLYDEAIAILEKTQRKIAAGEIQTPPRRSMANLRLTRFWLEMSAFHLEALTQYAREIEKHVPRRIIEGNEAVWISSVPTIRMSDCLAGYEGRSIDESEDVDLQAEGREWHEWYRRSQSNVFLWLEKSDPRYRALRDPKHVLGKLDPRLVPRALRMIEAAEDVMRNEGRSPWGWMVYYAEAETPLYVAVRSAPGGSGRPGVEPQEGGESTPRPGPRAGGPSSGSDK